ncbi:MAG: hypothetical protein IPN29_17110 [Saprospiraceae bacterium]|nr:hypothetical protein [Saprospiraceae bacterium]
MTLSTFLSKYDTPGSIVLLEGKRNVLDADKEKLVSLGKLLASQSNHITFRSGNAGGADEYFSAGVAEVDPKRMQVITPYTGHRAKTNKSYETISLDDIDLLSEPEVVYQSKGNKKTEKLIDQYVAGDKGRYAIKAAYIIRDTVKAIGSTDVKSANFGIFYDDLDDPKSGV